MKIPRRMGILPIIAIMTAIWAPALAAENVVRIVTLDWPPYTGSTLPKGGATTEVVRAAFEKSGYDIDVEYRPWKRAIEMAAKGSDGVIAYFPGYHCKHHEGGGFVASKPIGDGPLGFVENIDAPIGWESLDDIAAHNLRIGTVRGYANTNGFDEMVATGQIKAVPSDDDLTNLKKAVAQAH